MYKEASKQKLRFQTSRGVLNTEQLWDLPLNELDTLAVQLQDAYNNSKGKSFLDTKTTKDKSLKLRFDIVLDVLQTKVEENEAARVKQENKEHNEKILTLISEKKDDELKDKSVKELEKMLKY